MTRLMVDPNTRLGCLAGIVAAMVGTLIGTGIALLVLSYIVEVVGRG